MKDNIKELYNEACKARLNAYVPYSKFKVGASILMKDGKIVSGSNIENASYGLTICAERSTIFTAINLGYKKEDMQAICIVADTSLPVSPCGACRQVMHELLNVNTKVYLANTKGDIKETTISELLPYAFVESDL